MTTRSASLDETALSPSEYDAWSSWIHQYLTPRLEQQSIDHPALLAIIQDALDLPSAGARQDKEVRLPSYRLCTTNQASKAAGLGRFLPFSKSPTPSRL